MTLRFEINPPKIVKDSVYSEDAIATSINQIMQRVGDILPSCKGIHLTDSVLGVPRVSPVTLGAVLKKSQPDAQITTSIRVRDRNMTSLTQSVCDSLLMELDGILILKGDASKNASDNSELIPSKVISHFNEIGIGKKIDLFLSLPRNPNFEKIQKKIDSRPTGFVTQVIDSIQQVERIVDELKPQGFKIIPVILIPSEKNKKSAEFLKVDLSSYQKEPIEFINKVHDMTQNVIITSPNDFKIAKEILSSRE